MAAIFGKFPANFRFSGALVEGTSGMGYLGLEVGIAVLLTALCGGYGVAFPMVQNYEQLHHAPPGVGPHSLRYFIFWV